MVGLQWGNHNRAFPCGSNPINCFPSSCCESVESDGEEGEKNVCCHDAPPVICLLWGGGSLGPSPLWNWRGRSWKLGPRWSLPPLWSSDLSLVCPSRPREVLLLYGGIQTNSSLLLPAYLRQTDAHMEQIPQEIYSNCPMYSVHGQINHLFGCWNITSIQVQPADDNDGQYLIPVDTIMWQQRIGEQY